MDNVRRGLQGGRGPLRAGKGPIRAGSNIGSMISLNHASTIDLIVDYTPSMETVLPMVYLTIWDLVTSSGIGCGRSEFGLTFLSDEISQAKWKDKSFTNSGIDILNAMNMQEIRGTIRDNDMEEIEKVIRFSLKKLSEVPPEERVLIIFTDAYPEDYVNMLGDPAVRSVVLFMPEEKGMNYRFRMVDEDGQWNSSKTPVIFDLKGIVEERYLKKAGSDVDPEQQRTSIAAMNQLVKALS